MPKFIVTEVVKYEVEADDAAQAEQFIIDSENRDEFCVEVTDRYAEESDA